MKSAHDAQSFPWIALLLMAGAVVGGCARSESSSSSGDRVVYLCRETEEIIVGPPQATPAVNPKTGRPTLVRGLYCPECQKWRAVPSSEVHSGNPLAWPCPVHRQVMSLEGPLPEQTWYQPPRRSVTPTRTRTREHHLQCLTQADIRTM